MATLTFVLPRQLSFQASFTWTRVHLTIRTLHLTIRTRVNVEASKSTGQQD